MDLRIKIDCVAPNMYIDGAVTDNVHGADDGAGEVAGDGVGDNNIYQSSLFTDPDNGDFTLQASSPCIDAPDQNSQ